ncbi:MAG: ribbon-helix-helix protein, CopG family [Chloroflexota bacterium]|nr:hypothetical protein [Anaerolineales bacterium]MCA9974754.1 hypothetical protein [Anaerolineales bacterium]MCB8968095.1 hypothetical protein [Ardenticatenaceae bacterium]
MTLLRSDKVLEAIKKAYQDGKTNKYLRSYHLPEYQLEIIDLLSNDSGLSKAGVIRQIIDEWYVQNVAERTSSE